MSISRLTPSLVVFVVLAVLAAGCGSSGGGGGGGGGSASATLPTSTSSDVTSGGNALDGITIGNCLTESEYVVSPSESEIDGSSPAGGSFIITLYPSDAAAAAAAKKKPPKSTAQVESTVIEFKGPNSALTAPQPAPVLPKVVSVVKACIDQSK